MNSDDLTLTPDDLFIPSNEPVEKPKAKKTVKKTDVKDDGGIDMSSSVPFQPHIEMNADVDLPGDFISLDRDIEMQSVAPMQSAAPTPSQHTENVQPRESAPSQESVQPRESAPAREVQSQPRERSNAGGNRSFGGRNQGGRNRGGGGRFGNRNNNNGGGNRNSGGYNQGASSYNQQSYGQNSGYENDMNYSQQNFEPGMNQQMNYDPDMPLEDRIKEDLKVSFPGKGILEITPSGFGFLRPKFVPSQDDIYVSQSQIRKFWLRPGDEVDGLVRPPKDNEKYHGLLKIEKVNGIEMDEQQSRMRPKFNMLTSMYPEKQIVLETEADVISTRIMDLISPIGFGQRGLIVAPPKAGKTTLLKNIAHGIKANHPEAHLIAILIGERPEEVTDVRRSIDAEVVSSHFDQSPRDQVRAGEIGLERAKRLVETGKDVVILLDSITRLARAYNMGVTSSGRTLSGGFDPAALYPAKKFLGAARNCEEGGSLTIIGTALVNTESRMDDLIYEEFKGTGNMELHLDRNLANKRIFPAIDIEASGTRHDELILDKETMEKTGMLRRMMGLLDKEERTQVLVDKLKKTANNAEFLKELSGKL